jgi:predicted Zn-dependent protease
MSRKGKGRKEKQEEAVAYVAGFHLPSQEEIVSACGSFPWANDPSKAKPREDLLLGAGGGGKTTIDSIRHIDCPHFYQQSEEGKGKKCWCDLPPPADSSSWLAQVNEPGQTFQEYVQFVTLRSGKFKPNSNPEKADLYVLPLSEEEVCWPESGPALDGILEYVSAFFCRNVIQLDFVRLLPAEGEGRGSTKKKKAVIWRTATHECAITGRLSTARVPASARRRFQTHVDGLLTEISAVQEDGAYNGQPINNAFAVIGVTTSDLYSDDSDLFIAGMAAGGSKVAVLSLARYHPHLKMCPFHWDDFSYQTQASAYSYYEDQKKRPTTGATLAPNFSALSAKSQTEFIRRAGKLIVHEICHVYGLDHCVFYHCLMNGTGCPPPPPPSSLLSSSHHHLPLLLQDTS